MILIDTSSWIHMLRRDGNERVRDRVVAALESADACWCPLIRLELWNGAGGPQEKKILLAFERYLPDFPIDDKAWELTNDLARSARAVGVSIPATDLLIAACARRHGLELEHSDSDFDLLRKID